MGDDKKTSEQRQETTGTQVAQPTEQEQRILDLQESIFRAGVPGQTELTGLIPEVLSGILRGGQDLADPFTNLFTGISPEAISAEAGRLTQEGLVGGQALGITDSGVVQRAIQKDVAQNLLFPAQQSNLQRVFNLLNLGLGGGQQQVQLGTQQAGALGAQLAGLRPITTTGTATGTTTTREMNPFLRSFQTSSGTALGKGAGGAVSGFGGGLLSGLGGML